MSAAAASLATIFSAMGARATYQPPVGASVPCRVIPQGMARQVEVGGVSIMVDMVAWHLRRAEFDTPPVAGGILTIGALTWSLDVVEPCENDPLELKWRARALWGAPVAYRLVDGVGATLNPPMVDGLAIHGAVDAGASVLSIRGSIAVGQVRPGDVLRIGGDDFTVQAPISAAANIFANVAVLPAAPAALADGVAVAPRFAREFEIKAAEAEYLAHEVGGGVQAGDRRLVITQAALDAAGCTEEPSTRVQVLHRGRWSSVLSARAIGTGIERVAWDLQLR